MSVTKKPLSIEETQRILADLREEMTAGDIDRAIQSVEGGDPDIEQVERLLTEFCSRAQGVRRYMPRSNTPEIIEFIAHRLALYLTEQEPDLKRALGLKKSRKAGKNPSETTGDNRAIMAAKVLDLVWPTLAQDFKCDDLFEDLNDVIKDGRRGHGKTTDEAVDEIVRQTGWKKKTVRNAYFNNKEAAVRILLLSHLLDK